jgi:hypothetical protein
MGICLSREEIAELARTPQRKRQIEFMRKNGIRHYIDANGWPVVTRAAVEGESGSEQAVQPWKSNKAA